TFSSTTNRITNSNYSHDPSGDLKQNGTGTGTYTFQWDAENRMTSVDWGTSSRSQFPRKAASCNFPPRRASAIGSNLYEQACRRTGVLETFLPCYCPCQQSCLPSTQGSCSRRSLGPRTAAVVPNDRAQPES